LNTLSSLVAAVAVAELLEAVVPVDLELAPD
jgi:hypothetical protein